MLNEASLGSTSFSLVATALMTPWMSEVKSVEVGAGDCVVALATTGRRAGGADVFTSFVGGWKTDELVSLLLFPLLLLPLLLSPSSLDGIFLFLRAVFTCSSTIGCMSPRMKLRRCSLL